MGLGKSLGIGFIIYIVLNFLMNMLLVIAQGMDLTAWFGLITTSPFLFLSYLFVIETLLPTGFAIPIGISQGIAQVSGNPFYGIMLMVAYILPGLIASIIAGKMADNSKQGFLGWVIIALLCTIVLVVFAIINGPQMAPILAPILLFFGGSELWALIVFTLLVGLFNGFFWGGIAAITAAED